MTFISKLGTSQLQPFTRGDLYKQFKVLLDCSHLQGVTSSYKQDTSIQSKVSCFLQPDKKHIKKTANFTLNMNKNNQEKESFETIHFKTPLFSRV